MPFEAKHIRNFNKAKVRGSNFSSGEGPGANHKSKPTHSGVGPAKMAGKNMPKKVRK